MSTEATVHPDVLVRVAKLNDMLEELYCNVRGINEDGNADRDADPELYDAVSAIAEAWDCSGLWYVIDDRKEAIDAARQELAECRSRLLAAV